MRLISQFGEVEYFKNLKYDTLSAPNTALVIFRDDEAAQHCLKRSPIRFRMGKAPAKQRQQEQDQQQSLDQQFAQMAASQPSPTTSSPAQNSPWGVSNLSHTQTRALSTQAQLPKPPPRPLDIPGLSNPTRAPKPESRIFQIQANPSRRGFRDQINYSHFHGTYLVDTKSAAQRDLAQRVPLHGLSDVNWRHDDKPWRVVQEQSARDGSYRGSGPRKSLMEIYEGRRREDGT